MKVDMSPEAVTLRLKMANELRRTCLSLAKSNASKNIQDANADSKSVNQTNRSFRLNGD